MHNYHKPLIVIIIFVFCACSALSQDHNRMNWNYSMGQKELQSSDILHFDTFGNGAPLLLLHGFGENTYSWRQLIPRIPKGYKIYAIDLKGFGKSAKPLDDHYSIRDQANIIYDFILKNNLHSVTLVGHSMGGGVALLTALKLTATGKQVASLVLIDSIAYPQKLPIFISFLKIPIINWLGVSIVPPEIQVRSILRLAYFDRNKINEDTVRAYAAPLRQPGGLYALIATARKIIPDDIQNVIRHYADLKMPTLILWGREDQIVPLKIGEQLHRAIPNSTLHVIDFCGHIPHEEMPERANKIIVEFLDKNK